MHVHTLPELVSLAGGSVSLTLCPIADRRPSQFSTVFELYGPLGQHQAHRRAPLTQIKAVARLPSRIPYAT